MTNEAGLEFENIPVAQRSEPSAHNGLVAGSNPAGDTKYHEIKGLSEILSLYDESGADVVNHRTIKPLIEAGRAYAALPKMQKVDLDAMKRLTPIRDRANGFYSSASYEVDGYNRAIDDIKSKYGELYVEVK